MIYVGLQTAWNYSIFEQWRVWPVARLAALDRLSLPCWNLAFDIDLFLFDKARGFVGLF